MDRNILISVAVILLLSAFIGANFIYEPKMRQLRRLEGVLQEEEERNTLLDEIVRMEKRVQSYKRRLMEKGREEEELIARIQAIAKEVAIPVTSITPLSRKQREGTRGAEPQFISVKIQFEESYHQLGKFVATVENSQSHLRIQAIRLTTRPGTPSLFHEVEISTLLQP